MPQREVLKGTITEDEINKVLSNLSDGEYFIPRQVGLSETRFKDSPTDDDHCWFELERNSFEPTADEPTVNMTVTEFVERFEKAAQHWDEMAWLAFV
jgi:hypothetical protein